MPPLIGARNACVINVVCEKRQEFSEAKAVMLDRRRDKTVYVEV